MTSPQGLYQWLVAISSSLSVLALRFAWSGASRFIKLETLFNERTEKINKIDDQQRKDGISIAQHDAILVQVKTDIAAINNKLEPIPKIAAILERMEMSVNNTVPREEIDQRFSAVTQDITEMQRRRSGDYR
jgi:membrane-bound lytic murein transglycosylase B